MSLDEEPRIFTDFEDVGAVAQAACAVCLNLMSAANSLANDAEVRESYAADAADVLIYVLQQLRSPTPADLSLIRTLSAWADDQTKLRIRCVGSSRTLEHEARA